MRTIVSLDGICRCGFCEANRKANDLSLVSLCHNAPNVASSVRQLGTAGAVPEPKTGGVDTEPRSHYSGFARRFGELSVRGGEISFAADEIVEPIRARIREAIEAIYAGEEHKLEAFFKEVFVAGNRCGELDGIFGESIDIEWARYLEEELRPAARRHGF